MPALGLEVSKASIDELFDQWDRDGGGEMNLKELTKILRAKSDPSRGAPSPVKGSLSGAAKAAGTVALMKGK